jgi:hypothetical protein
VMNGIIFLVLFSASSLLVCRNATDFCMLNLYSATLLNLFIVSKKSIGRVRFSFFAESYQQEGII